MTTRSSERQGLSTAGAAALLERDGPNLPPQRPPTPLWRRIAGQVKDPLIVVLLVAATLTAVTGDWADMAVILLVVLVNTAVGVVQEVRADHAITALSRLTAPSARVIRDGAQTPVPAAEVVRGDLLVLGEGDVIPADAVVVESAGLLVDESALTGESVSIDKGDGDRLSAGTMVVRGRGQAEVTAVGAASAVGRIASMMGEKAALTPLQRRLAGVGRVLAAVAVALCALVLALGLLRGQPVELMVVTAISLVVAAVPESLPAVVTLSLALGARRMTARSALVRRLHAVETLGSVTMLATDKTGTLTEGRMVVREMWIPTGRALLTGSGYAPEGEIRFSPGTTAGDFAGLATAAALCNDATLVRDAEGRWEALGDPTEAALLAAAAKLSLDHAELRHRFPRIGELPFDSDRKRMTTAHLLPAGRTRVICKGAPEALLHAPLLGDAPELLERATAEADRLARAGYRVLAVARADLEGTPEDVQEHGLRLIGLVAMLDPPRQEAAAAVAACRRAGIRPLLITGDHPGTARAVAVELGIVEHDGLVADCREKDAHRQDATVYARATPAQKLDIIRRLRDHGEVLAMTGDGVNDGPALKHADIGVAMGRRGTEVARQAADLVLADDNLTTVVAAVQEGRRVYANICRFLVYGLSGGAAEIAVMLLGPFLGLPLPLLPAQILWINLITHGLPGVALGGEPATPGSMDVPPRPPQESILGAGLWQRVVRIAAVLTIVTLGVAVWAAHTGRPWQSMAFLALGTAQLGVALGSRTRPGTRANPLLPVAVAGAFALQLAGLYLPPLRDLLGTQPLTAGDLMIVLGVSMLGYAAVRIDRVVHPGHQPKPHLPSAGA
ncbi:cation-translocating P-type ATPase [Herbidospora daliensis]|uniref:cation-translocating P-type ATPase n=1 Tax=Herbidospora daliensis TaxID=295585 RepID=UPI000784AD40|nr:cation-transporting P-type ATPase [Herbidospora daliensis]